MPEQSKLPKNIRFRVGWKSGKIALDSQGRVILQQKQKLRRRLERLLWHEQRCISGRSLTVLLWVLPCISFAAAWLLVFAMVKP